MTEQSAWRTTSCLASLIEFLFRGMFWVGGALVRAGYRVMRSAGAKAERTQAVERNERLTVSSP
jgi:hypothetical protein